MTLQKDELKIKKISEIFDLDLKIPYYQRPYRWSYKSANILLNDIIEAQENNINEYRLGTVILHKPDEKTDYYNIVDGQQRLTTLSILLYCIDEKTNEKEQNENKRRLLKEKYSDLSYKAININYNFYKKRISEIENIKKLKEYILDSCKMVQIVTNDEQEAFQFFDSQNNRGKSLNPHDLLKSYHLREMNKMNISKKIDLINKWEDLDQKELAKLFETYLYPVLRWYKNKDGLNFSDKKIEIFKGIKQGNTYNYATYHKASNLYIEQFKKNGKLFNKKDYELNQFQLTQPIISGKRFFYYILHYSELLDKIRDKKNTFEKENKASSSIFPDGVGDKYINELYECILLFFADRFGLDAIDNNIMKKVYVYCYSLRLSMRKIGLQTINNYVQGIISPYSKIEDKDAGIAIFKEISEMISPDDFNLLLFPKITSVNTQYSKILNFVNECNGSEIGKAQEDNNNKQGNTDGSNR